MIDSLFLNWIFVALLVFIGFFCMLVSRNLIRQLIGIEIMSKGCILALISAGEALGNMALAQTLAITMIAIEVVIVAVGLALIVRTESITGTLDVWKLSRLKG